MEKPSLLRAVTLRHIEQINDRTGCGAKCPHADMIAEAEAATGAGQVEWRGDRWGGRGRWITEAGRQALASYSDEAKP